MGKTRLNEYTGYYDPTTGQFIGWTARNQNQLY